MLGDPDLVARGDVDSFHRQPLPSAVPGRQPIADGTRHRLLVPVHSPIFTCIQGDDVERVLMERAPHNGVHGSVGSVRVLLELALEVVHSHRLARALRPHQQQEASFHRHGVPAEEGDDRFHLLFHAVDAFEDLLAAVKLNHVGDVMVGGAPQPPVVARLLKEFLHSIHDRLAPPAAILIRPAPVRTSRTRMPVLMPVSCNAQSLPPARKTQGTQPQGPGGADPFHYTHN